MPNPLFNMLGGNNNTPNKNFIQFMQSMKGRNPYAIINDMVSSGKISQRQLDEIQQKANQTRGFFDQFKGMFGFR